MKTAPYLLKLLFLLALMHSVPTDIKAQPNIQHNIYFSEKHCSDSFYQHKHFYLEHSKGGRYSTFYTGYDQGIAKLDANWDTLFTVLYHGNGENYAQNIFEMPNGNIAIAGITESDDGGNMYGYSGRGPQVWLMEVDTFGHFIKAKTFGCNAWFGDASISSDGYILLAGGTNGNAYEFTHPPNGGSQAVWVAKYDTAFNQVWLKIYDNNGDDGWPAIKEVTPARYMINYMSDGTDAMTVPAEAKGKLDCIVYFVDSGANIIWKHRYGTPEHDGTKLSVVDPYTKDVYFVNNANYPGGDITWHSGNVWIQKVDTFGNNKGSKSYGGSQPHVLLDASWFENKLWIFSYSNGNIDPAEMDINTGLLNTNDAWIAVFDTTVNLVGKYTLQSDYNDYISDCFVYQNELYAAGNVSSPVNVPYKCDTSNSFKFVFKIGLAPLGIYEKQLSADDIFLLYPNPTDNTVYLTVADKYIKAKAEITVADMEGRTIYRAGIKKLPKEFPLDCSSWNAGNYIVTLQVNKTTFCSKTFTKR